MQLSARGALNVDTDVRLFLGRSMGTGRRVGILIRQRYALMSSICLTMQRANHAQANGGITSLLLPFRRIEVTVNLEQVRRSRQGAAGILPAVLFFALSRGTVP